MVGTSAQQLRWMENRVDAANGEAREAPTPPEATEPPELAPPEATCASAQRALEAGGARYLDCRSEMEFVAEDVVEGSVNIPFPHNGDREPVSPADFLEDVELEFRRGEEIYVGCRSGNRSEAAVAVLRGAGFARAVNVTGGIQAWRAASLPLVPYAG